MRDEHSRTHSSHLFTVRSRRRGFLFFPHQALFLGLTRVWVSKLDTPSCTVLRQPDLLQATSSHLSVQMPHAFKEALMSLKGFLQPSIDLVPDRSCPKSSCFGRRELFIRHRSPAKRSWLWMIIASMLIQFNSFNILTFADRYFQADTQNRRSQRRWYFSRVFKCGR